MKFFERLYFAFVLNAGDIVTIRDLRLPAARVSTYLDVWVSGGDFAANVDVSVAEGESVSVPTQTQLEDVLIHTRSNSRAGGGGYGSTRLSSDFRGPVTVLSQEAGTFVMLRLRCYYD